MSCSCINNKCETKEDAMKCKKCNNQQHYTKRLKHVPIAYVCSVCENEVLIEENKKKKNKEVE